MLSSSLLRCFFVKFLFTIVFLGHKTNGKNVTFVPEPISITVAGLPPPFNTSSPTKDPIIVPVPNDPALFVPEGFTVKFYMDGLMSPRYLLYTPTGDILVSEPSANRISCLIDTDGDGYPDERKTFANESNGLNRPYGMTFADGYFYVGSQNETRRYPWVRGDREIFGIGELVLNYTYGDYWTRTVVTSPDYDRIYISIGSETNVEPEPLPGASVQVADLNSTNFTTYAYGLRNPVGLAFHPVTKDLYVTCIERDGLGDDLVPNFFTRIEQGDFYGWPYAYLSPNLPDPRRLLPNGTSERPDLVAITRTPDVLFQAHSAVLDTRFYTGTQFPSKYHNGAFAAFHGSWNRNNGTGYKIVFIPFDNATNRPLGYYEDFVTGFLVDPSGPDTFGRPVGLLVLHDGSLLFTEDGNDRIYQVQYNNKDTSTTEATTEAPTTATTEATTTTNNGANNNYRFAITEFILIFNLFIAFFYYSQ
jgi:glucose/arabinose dehydrogenase